MQEGENKLLLPLSLNRRPRNLINKSRVGPEKVWLQAGEAFTKHYCCSYEILCVLNADVDILTPCWGEEEEARPIMLEKLDCKDFKAVKI